MQDMKQGLNMKQSGLLHVLKPPRAGSIAEQLRDTGESLAEQLRDRFNLSKDKPAE